MSNDLIGFEFLSAWTQVVAKYIVGMAAAFSANYDYAASVFEELQREIQPSPSEPPPLAKIRGTKRCALGNYTNPESLIPNPSGYPAAGKPNFEIDRR